MSTSAEVKVMIKSLSRLTKRRLKLNNLIIDLTTKLQNTCEHQSKSKDVKYYEGGYDYKPSETTTISCDICDAILSTKTIDC